MPVQDQVNLHKQFQELRCCVIIPTYNNDRTLAMVIEETLSFTQNVLVINDGSTDSTSKILNEFKNQIIVVSHSENQGKGVALRTGFNKALELNYRYAITIDSDSQHKASDLPQFLEKVAENPDSLIIGARNMGTDNVPGTSSFGHKNSNFWFQLETGIKPMDTQSGYRLYPIEALKDMRLYTWRYELEIEIIVRAAWKDIPILFVPIDVYYPPGDERVTHFRKVPDFLRVTMVNIVFVILAIFYYRPRNFIREVRKKNFREFVSTYVYNSNESNSKVCLGIWLGTFLGLSPFHGVKFVSIVALSIFLKLNKTLAIGSSYIGMPPVIPFMIFFSHEVGAWVLGTDNHLLFSFKMDLSVEFVWQNLLQQMVGGVVFAGVISTLITILTYFSLIIFKKRLSR